MAVEIVPNGLKIPAKHVFQHVLDDAIVLKRKKLTEVYLRSKNEASIGEKRRDPTYHRRESERRKLQCREEREHARKDKLLRMPYHSVQSESTGEVTNRTQTDLKEYFVRKKVEATQVTAFIHQRTKDTDKENADQVVVYRSDQGSRRHAWSTL